MYNWEEIAEKEGYKLISADTFTIKVEDSDGFVFKFKKQKFPKTRKEPRNCETPLEYFLFKIKDHPQFELMDFTGFQFEGRFKKSSFRCKIHDILTEMTPANLYAGQGCRVCGYEKLGKDRTLTSDEFLARVVEVHGDKYGYSNTNYFGSGGKVTIICPHHGEFSQTAAKHISGQGCPECAKHMYGYNRNTFLKRSEKNMGGMALYYVLECFNEVERFLKVGITTKSVSDRYRKKNAMPYNFTIRYLGEAEAGLIYDLEKDIFKILSSNKYFPKIDFRGKTECLNLSSMEYPGDILRKNIINTLPVTSEIFIKR